ncbi:restriction endonuclease subunit S [Vibrio breoganii]
MSLEQLITDNIDTWTSTVKTKATTGRGSSKKLELYGVKKLRELILELAVRGKLVSQDPNDEPASVLLERIAEEKAQLVKDKKIKKPKALPEISLDEIPFELPKGWEWTHLPNVAHYGPGKTPATKNSTYWDETDTGIPWVSIADLNDNSTVDISTKKVSNTAVEQVFKRSPIPAGTMLMSFKLTVGKVSILDIDAFHNEAIISIFPYTGILQSYLFKVLPSRANSGNKKNAIMGFTLNSESLSLLTIPVPPEAEQHRIVAKVDELMTLCDQLEQQTEASIEAHQLLVTTLLDTLTNSANAEELMQNWQMIAEHFDTLFTTIDSIDQLKQTILQLAVMGKLVPQDPNDEPAAKLLERIAEEKAQLIKEKKIKKQKALPPIADDEKPFELPKGWEWSKAGNICNLKGGFAFKSKEFLEEGSSQVIRMGNIRPDNLRLSESSVFIPESTLAQVQDYQLSAGEILLTMTGTKGKRDYLYSVLVKEEDVVQQDLYLNQRLCCLQPICISPLFINMAIKADSLLDAIYKKSTGTANQANIGMEAIKNWTLPIPPLDEQIRVVAKVVQLMETCEQLKVRLRDSQTTQLHLTNAIVEQAV